MAASLALTGNVIVYLLRYLVVALLTFSVFYTTSYWLTTEDLRRNTAGLLQRGASSLGSSSSSSSYRRMESSLSSLPERGGVEGGVFDVENIKYSRQKLVVQQPGKDGNTYAVDEDFYLSKVFGSAMQPSKVMPYYFKAEGVFHREEVTITTLITENRFDVFTKLVRTYQGPISVCMWIRDDESKDQHLQALHTLYSSEPLLRQFVDVHVVVDRFDFQLNMWRNIARLFARTDYFMLLDVDFHLCTDLKKHLKENEMAMDLLRVGSALVLPAFEFTQEEDGVDSTTFPKVKPQVEALVMQNKLMAFHSAKFALGHEASNYGKWYGAEDIYQVLTFNWKYEPYVILKKEGTPWCDERFVGYGANKAACLYEIYISGIDYYVLPHDFLIHQSHAYPESRRSGGRKLNAELYGAFRDELCMRYATSMYWANTLDSPKADNLKSQCSKLKGFTATMESFPQMWDSKPVRPREFV